MGLFTFIWAFAAIEINAMAARPSLPCEEKISPMDAFLLARPDGQILYKENEGEKRVPASTLKLLTALAAIHYLGPHYRFPTRFFTDPRGDLKVKGFGDPLLISESLDSMAEALSHKAHCIRDLILDDTYFSDSITIPGKGHSTNPYDAPVGALSANFNTVFFAFDPEGRIISAEPQTPMLPFARRQILRLGLRGGRYTFSQRRKDGTRYMGELLAYFLGKKGVRLHGNIRLGLVNRTDRPIYTYLSEFALEEALQRMLRFSNNFMANQIFISLGAHAYGPPGTLAKGVKAVTQFAAESIRLKDFRVVEGSGISRKNRLSPLDMLTLLKNFVPYRHLLTRKRNILYKTGSLRGIRARAGYIVGRPQGPYPFVIFLKRPAMDIDVLTECFEVAVERLPSRDIR